MQFTYTREANLNCSLVYMVVPIVIVPTAIVLIGVV